MSEIIEGYLVDDLLTDGKGTRVGKWKLHATVDELMNSSTGDHTSAVVLRWDDGDEVKYAGGYWLGPDAGDLFRGEAGEFVRCCVDADDDALDEAVKFAKSESERLFQRDYEVEQEQAYEDPHGHSYAYERFTASERGLRRNSPVMAWHASRPGGPFKGYSVLIQPLEIGSGGWELWTFRSDIDTQPDFVGSYSAFNAPPEWGARVAISRLPPAVQATIREIRKHGAP